MPDINNNMSSVNNCLWRMTRQNWVRNIHDEINSIRNGDDSSSQSNDRKDIFTPENNRSNSQRGILWTKRLSTGGILRARKFNGQIPTPTKENEFKIPVPGNLNFHSRRNLLNNCDNHPKVEPYFTEHSSKFVESTPGKKDPTGIGFENPILDALSDMAGVLSDVVSYGVGSLRG